MEDLIDLVVVYEPPAGIDLVLDPGLFFEESFELAWVGFSHCFEDVVELGIEFLDVIERAGDGFSQGVVWVEVWILVEIPDGCFAGGDGTIGGFEDAREDFDERGLAAPVASDDADAFARFECERDGVEDDIIAELEGYVCCAQDWHGQGVYALAEPEKPAVMGENFCGDVHVGGVVPNIFVEAPPEDEGGVSWEDELESIVHGVTEVLGFHVDKDASRGVHRGVVEEGTRSECQAVDECWLFKSFEIVEIGKITADNLDAEAFQVFEDRVEVVGGVDKERFEVSASAWGTGDGEAVKNGWGRDGAVVEVVIVGLCIRGFEHGDGFDAVAVVIESKECVVREVEELVESMSADFGVIDVDADREPEGTGNDADGIVA